MEHGNPAGLPAAYLEKIETIVSFLCDAPGSMPSSSAGGFETRPYNAEGEIEDLDFEDYH